MKNITLSISDELLLKSRSYAKKHNTSLNQIILDMLSNSVLGGNVIDSLLEKSDAYIVKSGHNKFDRDKLYDGRVL